MWKIIRLISVIIFIIMLMLGLIKMVTWNLMDEPWDELGDWIKLGYGVSEISPAGQLHQKHEQNGLTYVYREKWLNNLPTQYTSEIRLEVDDFPASSSYVSHLHYDGEHGIILRIYSTKIGCVNSSSLTDYINVDFDVGVFNVWRFTINSSGHSVKIYLNDVYVGEFTDLWHIALDGYVSTRSYSLTEYHLDYWRITSGLYPPDSREIRATKIAELHRLYGGGPYTNAVKEAYADVLVEVKKYSEIDGTWTSQNRRGKTRGYKDE